MIARGTILMMIGQASFLVSAFVINFGLARILGPVEYGTFGVVMSILVVVEVFVITGIPELIQKFGGENPQKMYLLKRATLPWQIVYCITVFIIFGICTSYIARVFSDDYLYHYLRIASFDIVFYGLFKYYQGLQNGLHNFEKHAILGITYALSKLFAILGLVLLGLSLDGALIGNALGSGGGLIAALLLTRIPKNQNRPDEIPYLKFVVTNVLYFLGVYLFFCIDLWFIKMFSTATKVGYYVSAGTLAKIPYVFSIGLSAVLLPSIARATKLNDEIRVLEIAQESMRYVIMFLLLFSVVISSSAKGVIRLLFGEKYIGAASSLVILIFGLSLITLFLIFNTILQSRNKMTNSFLLMLSVIILDFIVNAILVPEYDIVGAASATTIAAGIGVVIGFYFVNSEIKNFIPFKAILRLGGTACFIYLISKNISASNSIVLIKIIGLTGLYFIVLWLIGEIKYSDIARIKSIFLQK